MPTGDSSFSLTFKCVSGLKMFENRDIMWKIREITDFKHKIMYFEQRSSNLGVPLH